MSYKFMGQAVAQSIANAIKSLRSGKVDKVSGKGLSTNDYTTAEKNKLGGIASEANKTTVDTSITSGGTNPVTGGAIYTALSGKLGTSGDSKNNTVTFTSSDTTDANATAWTSVSQLTSGITHANFFARTSQMFKNVRYLYKLLGTTDISSIGNGSVTGALSTLNSGSATYIGASIPSDGDLNNYTNPGVYYAGSLTNLSNCPVENPTAAMAMRLEVCYRATTSRLFQIAYVYSSVECTIYIRAMNGESTWTGWTGMINQQHPSISSSTTYTTILDYVKYLAGRADSRSGGFIARESVADLPVASQPVFVRYQSDIRTSGQIYIETTHYINASTKHIAIVNHSSSTSITWTAVPTRTEMDTLLTGSSTSVAFGTDAVLYLYKRGSVIFAAVVGGTVTAEAGTRFVTIPEGYRPVISTNFTDTYNSSLRLIASTNGSLACSTAITNAPLRFSATWVCA